MRWKSFGMLVSLIGLPCLVAVACSQAPAPAAPAPPGAMPAPVAVAAPTPPAKAMPAEMLPVDGVWLMDDEGREYFVKQLAKPALFVWLIPEKRVRLPFGETYDVVGEDDQSFQVKIYRTDQVVGTTAPPEPSPEELARVAATYAVTTGEADRLEFKPFDAGLPRSGQWRNGFEVADMNGDGFLDIVHGPPRKGDRRPHIFLGDGRGNWRQWSAARYPPLSYDYGDAAVADFNADGRPDIALGVHLRGLMVLVASGESEFKSWGEGLPFAAGSKSGTTFSSRAIAVADWNGDGRPDLLALGEGPRLNANLAPGAQPPRSTTGLAVYLNQGNGVWVESAGSPEDRRAHGEDLAIVDLGGDGRVDALLGSSVMGAGDVLRRNLGDGSWALESLPGLRASALVEAVAAADLDADGREDLLVGYRSRELKVWRTGVDVFFGGEDGSYGRQVLWAEDGAVGLPALATGDVDGDGRADIAALTGDGRTLVFLNVERRRFAIEKSTELPAEPGGCQGYDVRVKDLDGDGRGELLTEFAGEPSALFAPTSCTHQGALRVWTSPAGSAGN